jgi:glycosyltransferase involved in cell wall biosynthesis
VTRTTPRVVFFQANFPSSIDYPNARPARLMQRRGLDLHVVTFGTGGRAALDDVPLWHEPGLVSTARRIRSLRPDLLFVETPTTSLALVLAARLSWVRSPVLSARTHKAVVQRALARAMDYATFCNPADAEPWQLPAQRVLDLPYPVDVEFWRTQVSRDPQWWTSRALEPPDGPVVACVSNLFAKKRQPEVVEWLAPLLHERSGARLVIAGRVFDEQVARDVRDAIARHDVADRVHVVGELSHDDTRQLYAWSSAAVVNSSIETQCMALYEALAAGVPVAIRDAPNLTSAFPALATHRDGPQLRENVVRYVDDGDARAQAISSSRDRVDWADVRRHDDLLHEHLDRLVGPAG